MHLSAIAAGVLLAAIILWDAFQTIVLSRQVAPRLRPTRVFYRVLWLPVRLVAQRLPSSQWRENVLTVFGPLSLLLLIAFWAGGLILAFALAYWGIGKQMQELDGRWGFVIDLYASGTTFFTLGIGDVTPRTPLARIFTVIESGLGLTFIAMVIGYVPLISQAFSRREINISMLDARAGSPPTAGRLLFRHFQNGGDDLLELLRNWERWSAELLESQLSFPLLSYFRSQHDDQSWVAALTAILDTCALVIARLDHDAVTAARLTFAMARHAVVDLCGVLSLDPMQPRVYRLPAGEQKELERWLGTASHPLRTDEVSITKFHALRASYEPYVHALSNFLLMPLPDWAPHARESALAGDALAEVQFSGPVRDTALHRERGSLILTRIHDDSLLKGRAPGDARQPEPVAIQAANAE
jgi:Ion channel